jgi:polysaccharide pyruvyl transferase WcaK-like protein
MILGRKQPDAVRARYVGYAKGTENHGDEALIWIIRDLLAPEIEVVFDNEDYDLALLGGGTLINQSPWLIDFFGEALDRARTGQGLTLGTGVGDLAFWGNQFDRWLPLLRRCCAVGVRGPVSLALLEQNGFAQAEMVGDPYLWLRAPAEPAPQTRRLGVNLGGTNNSLWGDGGDAALLDRMSEALIKLKAGGWNFSWISVWSRDLPLLERVRERVDPTSPPVLDARTQQLESFSALARCEIFIGEKLHACAMAAVAGVPFIALEYQPKVRDFAASLGMEPWVVSTAERDPQVFLGIITDLAAHQNEVRHHLARHREVLRGRLAAFVQKIKQQAQKACM